LQLILKTTTFKYTSYLEMVLLANCCFRAYHSNLLFCSYKQFIGDG